jgi:hypothetical protein
VPRRLADLACKTALSLAYFRLNSADVTVDQGAHVVDAAPQFLGLLVQDVEFLGGSGLV